MSLNLTAAGVDYSEAEGNRFEKPILEIPVELETEKIIVDHLNGDISITRQDVDDIKVETEVWVDQEQPGLAEAIAEQSTIEVGKARRLRFGPRGRPMENRVNGSPV